MDQKSLLTGTSHDSQGLEADCQPTHGLYGDRERQRLTETHRQREAQRVRMRNREMQKEVGREGGRRAGRKP